MTALCWKSPPRRIWKATSKPNSAMGRAAARAYQQALSTLRDVAGRCLLNASDAADLAKLPAKIEAARRLPATR